jgi:hypothetical protein
MADILILDAMGVLYEAGDDVAELLVPFVGRHGRTDLSAEAIDRDYVEASLGRMDTEAFWRRMGVDPSLEDAYLAGHRLIEGTLEALPQLKQRDGPSPACRTTSQAGRSSSGSGSAWKAGSTAGSSAAIWGCASRRPRSIGWPPISSALGRRTLCLSMIVRGTWMPPRRSASAQSCSTYEGTCRNIPTGESGSLRI